MLGLAFKPAETRRALQRIRADSSEFSPNPEALIREGSKRAYGTERRSTIVSSEPGWCDGASERVFLRRGEPFACVAPDRVDLARVGTVVFTAGFRPDYKSWVQFDAFDEMGFPLHQDGASTVAPGLYFMGVHFLRKRKSSLLMGVGEDAAIVAGQIASRLQAAD